MTNRTLQRMIHVACRELGIDADTRRDLQFQVVGKASMADMTEAELTAVVKALEARGFKKVATKGKRPAARRADTRFAHVLWGKLASAGAVDVPGAKGLNGFVRARFEKHWGSVPIDIDALQNHEQINDVVEALKQMCRRAGIAL